jgi:hypothetical protein
VVDTRSLSRLSRELRAAAPDAQRAARARIKAAAEVVAQDARQRASFSRRIPDSIVVRGSGLRMKIVAGGDKAPDAAPLENQGRQGTFRHPVFGNRERWVNQQARPFLAPALDAHREMVANEIEAAVVEAVDRAIGAR